MNDIQVFRAIRQRLIYHGKFKPIQIERFLFECIGLPEEDLWHLCRAIK